MTTVARFSMGVSIGAQDSSRTRWETLPRAGPDKGNHVDWKIENIVLGVSDIDRAKAFYVDRLGFHLDVDHQPNDAFRVVQLTPVGSACSITFGLGVNGAEPGATKGLHLVVEDIEAAHAELEARGVESSGLQHFDFAVGGMVPGVDPEHRDFMSYVHLDDPDGNSWVVQEAHYRPAADPAG